MGNEKKLRSFAVGGNAQVDLMGRLLAELAPPQSDLATDALAGDAVGWIEKHFRIPETPDHLIRLGEYQRFVLRRALTVDPMTGQYPYSVVVWSDIKKSIKSTIAAAVALWRAYTTPWASIKIVANDLKQADSRVSYYLRRAIELHPIMKKEVRVRPSGYTVEFPNHAKIEAIPVDPKGEAGGNDDLIIFSELWAANNAAASRMWTEMTLSPTKFGFSFRWVETYAGHFGEAPLLEQLYFSGVREGERVAGVEGFAPPLELYENESARLLCLWNDTPRLPWQTPAYYDQESAILAPSEFARVHRNQWASPEQIFIPPEWWSACQVPRLPPMGLNDPCILAVDAAVDDDSFGILILSGTPDPFQRYGERVKGVNNENTLHIRSMAYEPPREQFWYAQGDEMENGENGQNEPNEQNGQEGPEGAGAGMKIPWVEDQPPIEPIEPEQGNVLVERGFSFVDLTARPKQQQNENTSRMSEERLQELFSGKVPDHFYVRYALAFKPVRVGQHVSFQDAEATIRALIEQYNVVEMTYDPYMLEDMAQRFRSEGLVHLHAFNQAAPRPLADKMLHDVIRDLRLHALPGETELTEHLLNANARYEGERLRIVKRNRRDKVDLAVCASMALARAVFWHI